MKFVFAVALLCIGAVAAQTQAPQHNGRHLAETLEKRGEALLTRVKHTLQELRTSGHGHLAGALEHQEIVVEALVLDLKKQVADVHNLFELHKIHVIEEDLLHLENQVSDEIAVIENVRHHHQHQGHNATHLIAHGEELVKKARAEIIQHPHSREIRAIDHEVTAIEALVKALQAKPAPTAEELRKDEAQLARHEQTLNHLLERVHHRDPHNGNGH